jgi:cell division protein FtsQ
VTTTTATPGAKRGQVQGAKERAKSRIDPRIRARRVAVRRDEGRRRLRRLVVLVGLVALVALGYLATRSPLLDVDQVGVQGTVRTDRAVLVAAAGVSRGTPMTDVDLGRAERAIAALPWIDTVAVRRHWPGTVDIAVTERSVAAAVLVVGDAPQWLLVDRTGRVLESAATAPADLPHVTGATEAVAPGATQPAVSGALALVSLLTPDLRAWVTAVDATDDAAPALVLRGDVRVEFGSQAHLPDKMVDLATVLTRVDLADLKGIDLSVVHTPVLTRGPAAA